MLEVCESGKGFNSKDYKGYKPYKKPRRGYDWREYVRLNDAEDCVECCHMCDIRQTSCIDKTLPRYYCKKDRLSIQTSLGDY